MKEKLKSRYRWIDDRAAERTISHDVICASLTSGETFGADEISTPIELIFPSDLLRRETIRPN